MVLTKRPILWLTGTDQLADDNLSGSSKAHAHKGHKVCDIAADGYGGQTNLSQHLTYNDHIDHVVDHLQQVGQEQRSRECYQLFGDITAGKIADVRCFCHKIASFSDFCV